MSGVEGEDDGELLAKLKRHDHKPLSREERMWLKEQKKNSRRVITHAIPTTA